MSSLAEGMVILAVGCGRVLAECLQRSLAWDPPAEVVGTNEALGELLHAVHEHEPDVILIDACHPELLPLVGALADDDPRPTSTAEPRPGPSSSRSRSILPPPAPQA